MFFTELFIIDDVNSAASEITSDVFLIELLQSHD